MINVPKYQFVGPNTTGEALKTKIFLDKILDHEQIAEICLHQMEDIDLAGFNLLVAAYFKAQRQGKSLKYVGGKLPKFYHLVDLTQFQHVFA